MVHATATDGNRRTFLRTLFASVFGALAAVVPLAAGLAVALDPLRRPSRANPFVRVTNLDALPADGIPRRFVVTATRVDAWNRTPDVPVGTLYLCRTADSQIRALSAICPHAGCIVDFLPTKREFLCPCHRSTFTPTGAIANSSSPSPRPLDALAVEIRSEGEVWVRYENFETGRAEKIPIT